MSKDSFDNERKSLGLPMRTSDPMNNVTGDQELFKMALILPQEPFAKATFQREVQITNEDGNPDTITENYQQMVPKLVSTMALGNLNTKEVNLARLYLELSRLASWYGYPNIAIDYYMKVVHLNVTSQSHQGKLLTQILTETVSVSRKEETLAGTRDFTGEKSNKINEFIDKWKQKDAAGQMGGGGNQNSTQNFGLR